jgi:hypothetical protein
VTVDTASLVGVGVPDAAEAWASIGFASVDGAIPVANGALLLGHDGWVVAGIDRVPDDLEGVALSIGVPRDPIVHESGAYELDHVVLLTDSLERTSATVEASLGIACRRVRETGSVRQAFHRFADVGEHRGCIVEVVESDRVAAPVVMGVVFNVHDLHDLAGRLGPDVMSAPKPAVQAGRFISSVRRGVGLGTAVALMTPG